MRKQAWKTVLYALMSMLFLALIVFYHDGVHKMETMTECYFRAQRWVLLIGAVLLGGGISFRRHHKADVWFVSLLGAVLLTFYVVMLLQFGAMGEIPDDTTFTAVNVQMIVLDVAAVLAFARCAVCAARLRDADPAPRRTARAVCVLTAVLLVCLFIMGYGTRFAQYQELTETEYSYTQT